METTHTLYHFRFSIRSLFVRYAYALRGPPADPEVELRIDLQHVDLRPPSFDQLEESYICDINSSGEVPVLVSKVDGSVLPGSKAIVFALAEHYPQLMPRQHADDTHRLLDELHGIDFYALTFTRKYMFPYGTIATLLERRNSLETSDRYRHALDRKIEHIVTKEIPSLKRESTEQAIAETQNFMAKMDQLLQASQTSWAMSTKQPTALDTHLVVFVARLTDVGRKELVPAGILSYADKAVNAAEWKEMMQGQLTIPPGDF